ncbi:MAG TPA: N-acetyltransferase [Chloroflexi bacterium]|nr:N-acetyltransferase [Chloroflexota bacterium]
MADNITLREITAETVWPIMKLNVADNQKSFVAPNANSIAEAYFSKEAWFRAIYAGEEPVGFVMLYIDEKKPEFFLWRLMIASEHQGKGYGYLAMELVIDNVQTLPGANELLTSYVPGEGNPSPFYYKLGFEETDEWEDGEKVLKLSF